jgi:lipoyl-dependent peroxiredoxin
MAQASWQGDLGEGGGRIGLGSGAYEGPFTLRARVEDVESRTNARVRLEQLETGFAITNIALETEGDVPGVDAATFARLAQQAKDTCPVSRALAGTEITLEARLAGD